MALTTLLTIPQATVSAGGHTFGPSAVINSAISQFLIVLNQISWSNAGDLAITYSADYSLDGGTTWAASASGNIFDVPIPSKRGNVADQIVIACTIPGIGNANRKVRLVTTFAKTLTVSGSLEAQ